MPETGVPRRMALQDINMMTFGGMERTLPQWKELLEKTGLKIEKIWDSSGQRQSAIEAVLLESLKNKEI